MCPFEAVLSHIETYCDLTEVSSQEGNVSCAINHVVCTITKGLETCTHTTAGQQVKSWDVNEIPQLVWCVVQNQKQRNLTLISFIFSSQTLWIMWTSRLQIFYFWKDYYDIKVLFSVTEHRLLLWQQREGRICSAVPGINCMLNTGTFFFKLDYSFISGCFAADTGDEM